MTNSRKKFDAAFKAKIALENLLLPAIDLVRMDAVSHRQFRHRRDTWLRLSLLS
jgi:hypothetical protein